MSVPAEITVASILSEFVGMETAALPLEAARWALSLRFSEEKKERMLQLADLGNRGELSPSDHQEMAAYRDAGAFLSLLHAKARLSLRQAIQTNAD